MIGHPERAWARWVWMAGVLGAFVTHCAGGAAEAVANPQEAPALMVRGDAQAGHFTLDWSLLAAPRARFEVQVARQDEGASELAWHTIYRGPHLATFVSGLADGTRWFRARRIDAHHEAAWHGPVKFDVQHHDAALTLALFATGALVLGATVGALWLGHRHSRPPVKGPSHG